LSSELGIVVCEVLDVLILPLLPVEIVVGLPELGELSGCLLIRDVVIDKRSSVLVIGRCCKIRTEQEGGVKG